MLNKCLQILRSMHFEAVPIAVGWQVKTCQTDNDSMHFTGRINEVNQNMSLEWFSHALAHIYSIK